jgi:hypothetical protein
MFAGTLALERPTNWKLRPAASNKQSRRAKETA